MKVKNKKNYGRKLMKKYKNQEGKFHFVKVKGPSISAGPLYLLTH